jgi:hypothetical protein
MKIHQLIKRQTWHQGSRTNGKGAYCAYGWLERVYGPDGGSRFKKAYQQLRAAIGFRPIVGWNDNPNTDFNVVWSAFKKADI